MEKNLILTKAKGAVLSHDFSTAARLYKMLLNEDSSNVEYLKQLGSIYVQNHEDEKAIPYYQQIITFYPHYIEAMNSLGAIYRRLNRYEDSIAILQRAVDEGRDSASVYYNLGFTYKEMGNFKDAIDAFEFVIHENPDDVLAYNHLGSIYFAQKNYEKSINSYKRGLQIDQNHPILNYNLARAYEVSKNIPDAIRCYQAALKTRPGWIDAIRDFSELLIKAQKNKDAQNLVQQSIKLHPTDTDLLCLLGKIYLNQYDYDSAEKTFKKADSYKQNDVKILSGLAESLEKGEKLDKALDTILSALEIEPENKDIRKQYVHALLTSQDYDTALSNIKELNDETNEKDIQILDLYGQYYICKDDEEEAKKYYDKIKRLNHHYKDYMLSAATRYSQIGKYENAEKYANEFIERRPQNPDGYNILGRIFENKGDLQKALDSYNKSLSLRTPNVLANKKIQNVTEKIEKNTIPKQEIPVEQNQEIKEEIPSEEPVLAEKNEENDDFDFTQMGDNIPLQEGLVEDEDNFFDNFDDDLLEDENPKSDEEIVEEVPSENENVPAPQFFDPKVQEDFDDFQSDDFIDDDSQDDDLKSEENVQSEDELQNFEEEVPPKTLEDDFDFGELSEEKEIEPINQNKDFQVPRTDFPNQTTMEMQKMAMDNASQAMQAAFVAQKTAEQLAKMQEKFQEKTEKSIQEAINKIPEVVNNSKSENSNDESNVTQKDFIISAEKMLEKIENILKNDEDELKYEEEIELFKKLKVLISYLPEEERKSFTSCKMRLLMEYLISKMSGKPGLLNTSIALLKSGILGDDFKYQLETKKEDISNEMIKKVLESIKNLAIYLEDKELLEIIQISIETLLERIEMENLKSQIF